MFRIVNEVPNKKPELIEVCCGSLAQYQAKNIKLIEGQKVSIFKGGRIIQTFSMPNNKEKRNKRI